MFARKDTPFRAFALLSPVGLNAEEFGNTTPQKISKIFARLFIHNPMARDMWPHRPGNILAASEIVQQFVKDTVSGHLVTTISYALEVDLGSDLRSLVENEHPVCIFLPKNNAVFPPKEVKKAINTFGLGDITMIVEGSHSPTLTGLVACNFWRRDVGYFRYEKTIGSETVWLKPNTNLLLALHSLSA